MTGLFGPTGAPRVFVLPPGCDFTEALAAGLQARLHGQPPEALARVRIYLNTRRAARALHERLAKGAANLLPDIRVLAELAADPLVPVGLPPSEPPLRRKLLVARLIGAMLEAEPVLGQRTAMFELADSILKLLDEMDAEGVSADTLDSLDTGGHSEHWARSLRFLTILRDTGIAAAAHGGEARLFAAVAALAEQWRSEPWAFPVLVAGSTGSRGSTAAFMRAVAGLPQGAVILPGMDRGMAPEVWRAVGEAPDHPQHGLVRFVASLGLDPDLVPGWTDAQAPVPARAHLLSLALRPAPVTDQWFSEGPALGASLAEATAGMSLLEASGPQQEAAAIAIAMRGALAGSRSAALVTPDRVLARRVGACLARWAITPDDSAGRPLPLTPPGTLLRLLADLPGQELTPARLLALLKHPLAGGMAEYRRQHLSLTRRLELDMLRGGDPVIDWAGLESWARAEKSAEVWIGWLKSVFAAMHDGRARPLEEHLGRHVGVAEALSAGLQTGDAGPLWLKEAGVAARAALQALQESAADAGPLSAQEYRALLASHLSGIEVREEAFQPHPNLAIWGTLEARTQSADLIILGGLNETIWPPQPAPDVWLNRAMRAQLGLSPPERRTGLSAHDFQQAASAREIILSRSLRTDGAPTVPSRWLNRLNNLVGGLGESGSLAMEAMRARGAELAARADMLDRLADPAQPEPRPAPVPPVEARPKRLSVTRIETLVRDPYAIYASHVLGLRALDPAGRRADARTRGTVIHTILEAFVSQTRDGLPPDAGALFGEVADTILARDVPWPHVRRLWRARMQAIAPWFLGREAERRQAGRPLATEAKGRLALSGPGFEFTLIARADRIDLRNDGSLAIYDYKAGAPPTANQVKYFAKQLLLEAVIAEAGGFDPGATSVGALAYIGLGSGGKEQSVEVSPELIAGVRDELMRQIISYQAADTPFPARTRVQLLSFEGDYDQLSRLGEWRDGDGFAPQVVG